MVGFPGCLVLVTVWYLQCCCGACIWLISRFWVGLGCISGDLTFGVDGLCWVCLLV